MNSLDQAFRSEMAGGELAFIIAVIGVLIMVRTGAVTAEALIASTYAASVYMAWRRARARHFPVSDVADTGRPNE